MESQGRSLRVGAAAAANASTHILTLLLSLSHAFLSHTLDFEQRRLRAASAQSASNDPLAQHVLFQVLRDSIIILVTRGNNLSE